jgi:hypothetical protein
LPFKKWKIGGGGNAQQSIFLIGKSYYPLAHKIFQKMLHFPSQINFEKFLYNYNFDTTKIM